MVKHPGVVLEPGKGRGNLRRTAGADDHRAGLAAHFTALLVLADHIQPLHPAVRFHHRLDTQHLLAIAALPGELHGDPAQIVVVLHAARIKGAQVDEVHQSAMGLEVVDEREAARRVAQGHQVLEERNLQFALGHQGIAMPVVVGLALQEHRIKSLAALFRAFLQGNGQGQVGRAEADADQVVGGRRVEVLGHGTDSFL